MKSIRVHQFGGPETLKLEELPDPKAGPGQVVVKLEAIGVNPVETYIRAGKYGPKPFPYTPGSDAAGVVESIGDGVKSVQPGDRVYLHASLSGAYAEKALCAESHVHKLPAKISFAQGAALGVPYATAFRALYTRGKAAAGETVLVHGASGGVGIAAVQLARASGLTVFGTAGTAEGLKLIVEQSVHHALNHHDPDYLTKLVQLNDGKGVDLIIEMAAHLNLAKDLTVLARNGRVVVVGSRAPIEINPRETMGRDADIRGMTLMNATDPELKAIHQALVAGLELGYLRPVIGKELPLSNAAEAHEAVMAAGAHGKIVLIPSK